MTSALRPPLAARLAPKGKFYGWWIAVGCMILTTVNSGVGFYGLATLLRPIRETYGWTNAQVSLASFVYYIATGIMAMTIGPLIDRYGSMKFMFAGAWVIAAAIASVGHVRAIWHLYVAYFVLALGFSLMSAVAINAMIARWFIRQRGKAMGIAALGSSAGGILAPPLISRLVTSSGLGVAAGAMGAVVILMSVPTVLFVLSPSPAHVGQFMDGDDTAPEERIDAPIDDPVWTTRQAVHTKVFWMFPAVYMLAFTASNGFLLHQLAFLQEKFGSRDAASYALSATAFGSTISRMVLAGVVDRLHRRYLAAVLLAFQGASIFAITFFDGKIGLYVCVAVFGLTLGNGFLLQTLLCVETFGVASFGRIFGLITFFNQIAFGVGPLLVGWMEDHTGSYVAPFRLASLLTATSAVLLVVLRPIGRVAPLPGPATAGDDEAKSLTPQPVTG
ncbi:MAG: MFS transporter [Acidimicrobiia bacterium]